MQKLCHSLMYPVMLVSALSVATACKKYAGDQQPGPRPAPTAKKLVKIEEGTSDVTSFEYNTNGTLKKVDATYQLGNAQETFSWTLSYNNDNRLSQMVSDKGTKVIFFYKDGLLQRKENRDINGALNFVDSFYYENGQLSRFKGFALLQVNNNMVWEVFREVRYTYYSINNIKEAYHRERNSATGQLENSILEKAETYDSQVNPLSLLGDLGLGFFHSINTRNPVDEVVYDFRNGDYYMARNTTNQYTYDADGYPVLNRQTITLAGQQPVITNIKYTYR